MGPVFYLTLNMGIMASAIGLVVLLLRLILRGRLPALARYALWGLVLLRLLLPVSLPSQMSAWNPVGRYVTRIASFPVGPGDMTITNAVGAVENSPEATSTNFLGAVNAYFPGAVRFKTSALRSAFDTLGTVWLAGAAALAAIGIALYALTARRLGRARRINDDGLLAGCAGLARLRRKVALLASDAVESPVAFGVFRPRVAVPSSMACDRDTLRLVLLHELTHIRRLDTLRVLLFLVVCLHWYNPLIWLCFLLSGRDMELACDAAVLRLLGKQERKRYALALADLAAGRQPLLAAAFGRSAVRERVLGVVNFRRVTWAAAVLSALFVAGLAVVLLTNPAVG